MGRLFVVMVGCGVFASACGGSETPAVSAPMVATDRTSAEPTTAAAPTPPVRSTARTRERAPEASSTRAEQPLTPATALAPAARVPEYRELVIPSGTLLSLTLETPVRSGSSQVEDLVRATLREELRLADDVVLPAGVEVRGRIIEVEKSGRVKGRARLAFRFTALTYNGDEYDLRTAAIERVAAATKGEDATKIGIGAGAGAALGVILGGGNGAAKGAAIGAAAGTGAVLATRGDEVQLDAGEIVDTRLTAELPVRVRVQSSGS